jgi:hypothetical protein
MIRYVKICPKCGHANEETAIACAKCPEFFDYGLGAVPYPDPAAKPTATQAHDPTPPEIAVPVDRIPPVPVTQRMDQPSLLILRSHADKQVFSVRSGLVVGQGHPSRPAGVQILGVPGCAKIHRHHCRFHQRGGQWFVQAIDQRQFGKKDGETHPTAVNGALVAPGGEYLVRDGDLVALAGVSFTVNIMGT